MNDLETRYPATENQQQLALSMGLADISEMDGAALVSAIETRLGQDTMLEQARWFVLSIFRQQTKGKWQRVEECELDTTVQYELAREFIASADFLQSLRTVLKDTRCRFTLLRFAKNRKPEDQILSTTTKAYKRGRQVLIDADHIRAPKRKSKPAPGTVNTGDSSSVVNRRAARRGYSNEIKQEKSAEEVASEAANQVGKEAGADEMSEEEYAELEKALTDGDAGDSAQHWQYRTNEDRLSLLLGLVAGCGFFVLVFWLLL